MRTPERIHVNWNAADAYERFAEAGVTLYLDSRPAALDLEEVIIQQAMGLFVLSGWTAGPEHVEVTLTVHSSDVDSISVRNLREPSFVGAYRVASEPPPRIAQPHGDLLFDLVKFA